MITGAIRRATGFSEVEEKNGQIIITGAPAEYLARDMKRIWTTSKVASSMFIKVTWSEIRIPSFFALEFKYILTKLLESRGLHTSKRVVRSVLEGINENTWIRNLFDEPTQWLKRQHLRELKWDKLLPHQTEFLDAYERTVPRYGLKGMLLSAAPGSGKTVTGCSIALLTEAEVVIIVCPKNASKRVWEKTLQLEFKVPQNPFVADDMKGIEPSRKWHIFHYEALDRALELAKVVHGKNVCVILDESHNFNEIKSLRTERFLKLCTLSGSKNIIWASGTPIKALGFEAIPLLRSIDPLFTEVAEVGFRKMFGRDARRTLDILSHRIGLVSHTTTKQNVMSDEPEYEQVNIKMPNSDKYTLGYLSGIMNDFIKERTAYYTKNRGYFQETYDNCLEIHRKTLKTPEELLAFKNYTQTVTYMVRNGFDARHDGDKAILTNKYEKEKIHLTLPQELRKMFVDAKSVIKYPELKVRGECLGRILTKERIQCHVDMLAHIDFDSLIQGVEKKTIIFTSYVRIVDACFDLLKTKKYQPLRVYGDTNNELVSIVNKFEKDSTANPLVTTYQSLSTAVPLVMANGIIFLNSPWRSFEREQAVARAHRIGQDKTVYVFDIILDTGNVPNISSRSLDIMQWSKEQVDQIMGIRGDVNISVECNGFGVPMQMDYNEILDDVLYDPEQKLVECLPDNTTLNEIETQPYYPEQYRFYAQT